VPPSPSGRPPRPAAVIEHGPRDSGQVALTLDMGGRLDPALDIMDWLIERRVKATIFPTGKAASQTEVGRKVLALVKAHPDLFDLGNHSWDHPDFRDLGKAEMADQLERTEDVLREAGGGSTKPWFRPPYGGWNNAVRAGVGEAGWRSMVMWDIDTIDWRPESDGGPTAAQMTSKVVSRAEGGSIVLMHLGGWNTLDALPGIVDGIAAKGLTPVTLNEMFAR
jgi:peptidoglycan/xylan/chitin deacetylase (PgdA/CDA1 family)